MNVSRGMPVWELGAFSIAKEDMIKRKKDKGIKERKFGEI